MPRRTGSRARRWRSGTLARTHSEWTWRPPSPSNGCLAGRSPAAARGIHAVGSSTRGGDGFPRGARPALPPATGRAREPRPAVCNPYPPRSRTPVRRRWPPGRRRTRLRSPGVGHARAVQLNHPEDRNAVPTRPLTRIDGFLPIEEHGIIGDGATCALVARDGSIPWLCLPDFDSRPFLAGLLDTVQGGIFRIAPVDVWEAGQRYVEDTGVLVTELHGADGVLELTDCMTLRTGADLGESVSPGRGELLRLARVVSGTVEVDVRLAPFDRVQVSEEGGGWRILWGAHRDVHLVLWCSHPLALARDGSLTGRGSVARRGAADRRPGLVGQHPDPLPHRPRPARRPHRRGLASLGGATLLRGTAARPRAPLGADSQTARPRGQRRDHGRRHLLAARGDRRRAQLGLPLHLGPRRRLLHLRTAPHRDDQRVGLLPCLDADQRRTRPAGQHHICPGRRSAPHPGA